MTTISLAVEDKVLWSEVHAFLDGESVQIDFEQPQASDLTAFSAAIDRSQSDVVLIDVSVMRESLAEVIRKTRFLAPDSMIVALSTAAAAGPVLECFRAGADEYLFPPLAEGLKGALERHEAKRKDAERGSSSGKVVAFLSVKGGCGGTTLACHAAAALARLDQRTLLADFDIAAGMVAFLMKSKSPYSIADALNNVRRLDTSYWKALVSNGTPNLEVISAPALMVARREPQIEEIRQVLAFMRRQYQWTVTDAGTGISPSTMTALELADEACLITTPEIPALHQTKQILQKLLDVGYKQEQLRLILNRVPKRSEIRPDEIEDMLSIAPYAVFPECAAELHEAFSHGQLLPANSDMGRCTERMVRKLAGVAAPKPRLKVPFFR